MATPREITFKEFNKIYNRLFCKAIKLSKLARRDEEIAYWFSSAFKPCSGEVHTTNWKYQSPNSIDHYTSIPCDEYCSEKMPMATCLIQTHNGKFYTCRHKVGNCPWKV